jgi:chemotaxis protein CheX
VGGPAKVQIINQYVNAAANVLSKELGAPVTRNGLELEANPYTSEEITAVIGVSGSFAGSVYLAMAERTALGIVSIMIGQEMAVFDDLAQSGIAELANVVAGAAGVALSEHGHATDLTPPLLLVGAGARLSSELQRLVVPLQTIAGTIRLHVALRETA